MNPQGFYPLTSDGLQKLRQIAAISTTETFYAIDIKVDDGHDDRICGEDRVDLSRGGHQIVSSREYPKVAGLRLPARFPSGEQLAHFRSTVFRVDCAH